MKENFKSLNINSTLYKTRLSRKFENRKPYSIADQGLVRSFIPGTITDVLVKEGQPVKKGDEIVVLDAMKMRNRLKSAIDGVVRKINVSRGDRVPKGACLVEIG
ncbi:MAG TPA: acetyl-CoA carboxylase biotin carboxyl carrier protein subunit [Bacteroidales bacterium]|nr:acetyl-CoA carboxylase biotin carboxyl carrier protein subunit [Bacteroidales bacterium]